MNTFDWRELLQAIDPARLDYSDWVKIGMAVKHEGGAFEDWDAWSAQDAAQYAKNKPDAMRRKWARFNGGGVTEGTLYYHATAHGWKPTRDAGRAYELDDIIHPKSGQRNKAAEWAPDVPVPTPGADWNGASDLIRYIEALFSAEDYVGFVLDAQEKENGKHTPGSAGVFTLTAGELLKDLKRRKRLEDALGTQINPAAGAWIRFNPLDGKGVRDSNVTAHRYALVESDTETLERQRGIYDELQLPIAALVNSGNKSLHAIVRIDAKDLAEYKERVEYLYAVCKKEGLAIDAQNKNAARLSRMPGIMRNGQPQNLVAVNVGKPSWDAWRTWREELEDHLPDVQCMGEIWNDPCPLAMPLIDGVLRCGHKMLLSGPSKAGKSFLLLQLAIAIAEGKDWIGWPIVSPGRVLYVNLELDEPSCIDRIKTIYKARGWSPDNAKNLDVWHLRGKAAPLNELAPKMIRRALKKGYKAIIIDPLYKVLTGDENSAADMALFCNQFDRVAAALKCAVIYCHHHSKGEQGHKRSRDRSSGSGVFSRDPDAILDLIELQIDDKRREVLENNERRAALHEVLNDLPGDCWRDEIAEDDMLVAAKFVLAARKVAPQFGDRINAALNAADKRVECRTGWRVELTLREFAPAKPRNIWYEYPVHDLDGSDLLMDARADGETPPKKKEAKEPTATVTLDKIYAQFLSRKQYEPGGRVSAAHLAQDVKMTVPGLQSKARNILHFFPGGLVDTKDAAQERALELKEAGHSDVEIAREVGVSRKTILDWRREK